MKSIDCNELSKDRENCIQLIRCVLLLESCWASRLEIIEVQLLFLAKSNSNDDVEYST